jgi:capsular polysaccharide transport system permease protein
MLKLKDEPVIKARDQAFHGNFDLVPSLRQWLPLAQRWFPLARRQDQAGELRFYRASRWRALLILALLFSPTMAGGVYYAFIATGRYLSEAHFVVRTASKSPGLGSLGAVLQMVGFTRAEDDTYSVQDYISSREGMEKLSKMLALRKIYGRPEADFLARYPSIIFGPSDEEFFKYLKSMINVTYNDTTGITTLKVQAFRPEDAHAIAVALLDLAEQKVNELNERIRGDAVRVATEEVNASEQRLADDMTKMTEFQNRELVLDPVKTAKMMTDLIGQLDLDLADTQSTATELASASPSDPSLSVVGDRVVGLKRQIEAAQEQMAGDSKSLADKLGIYEHLAVEREFAAKALDHALESLDNARTDALRQQLFLERVAAPNDPDYAMMPLRGWDFATITILNMTAIMIGWLFKTGLREHVQVDS